MKIETILVPTDFSAHADKAFETAVDLAKVFGARIELLHAYDFGQWVTLAQATFAERLAEQVRIQATKKMRLLVDRAKADGIDVSIHLALGSASELIIDRAKETKADLLVMGTRGVGLAKHLFLGSVAERTIQLAPCPVLTVTADPAGENRTRTEAV